MPSTAPKPEERARPIPNPPAAPEGTVDLVRVLNDAGLTPAARTWFQSIASAEKVAGDDLLRRLGRVRLTIEAEDDKSPFWNVIPQAAVRRDATAQLAGIGLTVDAKAPAELVLHIGDLRRGVRSTLNFQSIDADTRTVWVRATLWLPATVLRGDTLQRVRAALASATALLVTGEEPYSVSRVAEVTGEAIAGLPYDAELTAAWASDDAAWSRHLLRVASLGNTVWEGHRKSVAATDDGRRLSYAGITALAPGGVFGLSPQNRSVGLAIASSLFDPAPFWPDVTEAFDWRPTGDPGSAPVPMHELSAYPLGLTTVIGGPGQGTGFVARLQHAGLRESNCIVNAGGVSFRVSCQTAEATVLYADFDDDRRKAEVRVLEKLIRSIDAATPPPSTAFTPASGQSVAPPFFPERLYVLYQKEQPFDGSLLGPPHHGAVPRAAARQVAVDRFLALVVASGVRESEVTRAIFEGRLSVDIRDLYLVKAGLSPLNQCDGWNTRFGSMLEMGAVRTIYKGQWVTRDGRDFLMSRAVADVPYAEAIAAPGADKALIDRQLARENSRVCPAEYFNFQRVALRADDPNRDYALLREAARSQSGK